MKTRHFLLTLLASATALMGTSQAVAQQQRPIRLVVPYAAGGPIDNTARILAERVKDTLGPVIIDNKPGAGGNIGADAVAKAPHRRPDHRHCSDRHQRGEPLAVQQDAVQCRHRLRPGDADGARAQRAGDECRSGASA
jgi:hypothetical protein